MELRKLSKLALATLLLFCSSQLSASSLRLGEEQSIEPLMLGDMWDVTHAVTGKPITAQALTVVRDSGSGQRHEQSQTIHRSSDGRLLKVSAGGREAVLVDARGQKMWSIDHSTSTIIALPLPAPSSDSAATAGIPRPGQQMPNEQIGAFSVNVHRTVVPYSEVDGITGEKQSTTWESEELGIILRYESLWPRGEVRYSVEVLSLEEPEDYLFELPAGYEMLTLEEEE